MGKKPFWSRDKLVKLKHEFDCLVLRARVRVVDSFGVLVRVRIRVYVEPFCSAEKP